MKNILVPIGSSENSASNLAKYAIDLAKEVNANVYVASVFQNSKGGWPFKSQYHFKGRI